MEHLPLRAGVAPIVVPFICTEEYDSTIDFLAYPERMGWDISSWHRRSSVYSNAAGITLGNGKKLGQLPAFLQTWLFFGLLTSCLKESIPVDSFVQFEADGGRFITTSSLPAYLERWKDRSDNDTVLERESYSKVISSYLAEAAWINDTFTWFLELNAEPTAFDEELKKVLFCTNLLERALTSARRKIFQPGIWFGADVGHKNLWLEQKMSAAGWCPYAIKVVRRTFDLDLQAYAFSLGTVRTTEDHGSCTESCCLANQMIENSAVKHTTMDCDCELVYPPLSEVVSILRQGQIPLVYVESLSGTLGALRLRVEPYRSGSIYVAISHVWADGLGSPSENTIPYCQMLQLKRELEGVLQCPGNIAGRVKANGRCSIPFWLDTLCIPVGQEYQDLRDFSISNMYQIYKEATGVLILDPDLRMLSRTASFSEILLRVLISGWRGRLWTFQEGALGYCTYISGKDRVFALEELRLAYYDKMLLPEPLQYCMDEALLIRLNRAVTLSPQFVQKRPELAIQRLLAAITERTTSRAGDETVCIASFLNIDPSPLLQQPMELRMQTLLTLLPHIPPNIVFALGPRIKTAGFRWAATTLLSPHGVNNLMIDDSVALDPTRPSELSPRPMSYIHPVPENGLVTFFPGIRLFSSSTPVPKNFYVRTSERVLYRIEVADFGMGRSWEKRNPYELEECAIILSSFDNNIVGDHALLVETYGETVGGPVKGLLIARTCILVGITRIDQLSRIEDRHGGDYEIGGEYMPPRWWLID